MGGIGSTTEHYRDSCDGSLRGAGRRDPCNAEHLGIAIDILYHAYHTEKCDPSVSA